MQCVHLTLTLLGLAPVVQPNSMHLTLTAVRSKCISFTWFNYLTWLNATALHEVF